MSTKQDDDSGRATFNFFGGDNKGPLAGRDMHIQDYQANNEVAKAHHRVRILVVGANPDDSSHLRLNREVREIEHGLRLGRYRDRFVLSQLLAAQPADLQGHLLSQSPTILHFSGHGKKDAIVLEGPGGTKRSITVDLFTEVISKFCRDIRCVVLNSCHSEHAARALAGTIDCVIGMSGALPDSAAIRFSAAFYESLAAGQDVRTSFDLGCSSILMGSDETASDRDVKTHHCLRQDAGTGPLLIADRCDPSQIILAEGDLG